MFNTVIVVCRRWRRSLTAALCDLSLDADGIDARGATRLVRRLELAQALAMDARVEVTG
ncbi:hypothetical protein Lesp02_03980 [Lentzea sp. NBRC 105346]|uniref:hypothetical protein n=1 Tax=Lentzea sp. NBRC 105346 TaxID=3032205 RepID=UPI0024A1BA5D|nr:hypothetical protein [Lentzea sp. NBRC 105346]GLZ28208.1 hypothetical protein Lesp02_03980 [Lentzea sp. NBRC 105346]